MWFFKIGSQKFISDPYKLLKHPSDLSPQFLRDDILIKPMWPLGKQPTEMNGVYIAVPTGINRDSRVFGRLLLKANP